MSYALTNAPLQTKHNNWNNSKHFQNKRFHISYEMG